MQASGVIWITGFGPFPGVPDNPSARVARSLHGTSVGALKVVASEMPVVWAEVPSLLTAGYDRLQPRLAVHVGVASRRRLISVERYARNRLAPGALDAIDVRMRRPRIDIKQPYDMTLRTTLNPARLAAGLRAEGMGARASSNAGAYLCNYSYWHGLVASAAVPWTMDVLFIHLPAEDSLDAHAGQSWTESRMVSAMISSLTMIEAALDLSSSR